MPQQQVPAGSALIEGVERTNVVMVCPNQRAEFAQHSSYAMDINRENRNCYNCGEFGHLVRNCRNRDMENRMEEERRLEYGNGNNGQRGMMERGDEQNNNLNGN